MAREGALDGEGGWWLQAVTKTQGDSVLRWVPREVTKEDSVGGGHSWGVSGGRSPSPG